MRTVANSWVHLLGHYQLTCLFLSKPDARNCGPEGRKPWVFSELLEVISSNTPFKYRQLPDCIMVLSLAQSFVHLSSATSLKTEIQQPLQWFCVTGNLPWCLINCCWRIFSCIQLLGCLKGQGFPAARAPGLPWGPSGQWLATSTCLSILGRTAKGHQGQLWPWTSGTSLGTGTGRGKAGLLVHR